MPSQVKYVDILLPQRVGQAYTYASMKNVELGQFVEVPLRNQTVPGVVWAINADAPQIKAKQILKQYDCQIMPERTREFIRWVAQYTLSPIGNVLKMAMSVTEALSPENMKTGLALADDIDEKLLTPKRQQVLDYLRTDATPLSATELSVKSVVSTATIKAMLQAGLLKEVDLPPPALSWTYYPVELSVEQTAAAAAVSACLNPCTFKVFLLDGVTGSGKTEVYFETIGRNLQQGKQSLILLPEISLSAQWIERFTQRFGTPPVVWHSDMSASHRKRAWRQVLSGEAKVVVGARSALFLPYPQLGLIVVDEEHESSYKQEEVVIYNARDMAVVRARMESCPIILASATPSLETIDNAKAGKYEWLRLHSRHGAAQLPHIHIIDMRNKEKPKEGQSKWISPTLQDAITQAIESKQQALVFLNRRGYAPLTVCQSCGEKVGCPNCSTFLVEHKIYHTLLCHHCGHTQVKPKTCSKCGDAENMTSCGPGVERVAEDLEKLFPNRRIAIMSSDIVSSLPKLNKLVDDLLQGRIDIVVGTQMIAKGHHFPNLTVVGVVDADVGLTGSDLRAGERTYQLLHQVAGRAGRADLKGHVYLQTYSPAHPVLKALISGRRDDFIAIEETGRKMNELPPYGRLAAIIISSHDKELAETFVRQFAINAPGHDRIQVFGPAPAAIAMVRGWHRWRFLLKSPKDVMLQPFITQWLNRFKVPAKVKVQIDIDPYNFM